MQSYTLLVVLCLLLHLRLFATAEENVGEEGAGKAYDEILRETTLHTLITDRNFVGAMERLKDYPEEASVLVRTSFRHKLVHSHMPLHQVFQIDLPMDLNKVKTRGTMPKEQVDLALHLIEVNPRAVAQKDNNKRLPLHVALLSPTPPPTRVIKALIDADPESVKVRGDEQRVALHFATAFPMTTHKNTELVLDAFPAAVEIQDEEDSLPLHLAAWGGNFPDAYPTIKALIEQKPSLLSVPDGDGETVVSLMAKYGRTSPEAAGYVLRLDLKGSANDRDEFEGNTVLHHVVASSHDFNSTLYQPFLGTHPGLAQVANRVRKLPLHVALWKCCTAPRMVLDLIDAFPKACSKTDIQGMLPLHHACNAGVSDLSIVKKLLELNPNGSKLKVTNQKQEGPGRLPLHLALNNPFRDGERAQIMDDVIFILLELYPESAGIVDPISELWPLHMALASKRSYRVIKRMLKLAPEAVSIPFEIQDPSTEKLQGTALHVFVQWAQTYMKADEITDIAESILRIDPSSVKKTDGKGRTPVHVIWTQFEQYDDNKLALAENLIRAYPETTHTMDNEGKTPLTYACFSRHVEGIKLLLEEFPVAIHIENKHGQHPLHQLCDFGAKGFHTEKLQEIMSILLEKHAESAAQQDDHGQLPLHILAKTAGIERFNRDTIHMLLDAYPEAAHTPDNQGMLPLNLAVQASIDRDDEDEADYWIGLYDALLDAAPEAVTQGGKGATPFAYALRHVDTLSKRRLHEHDHVLYLVERLYRDHPDVAVVIDRQGRNALHNLVELLGDMGGSINSGWGRIALHMLEDYPELAARVDRMERSPLSVFVYYLCETAIGRREDQSTRSMETSYELEMIMDKLLNAFPNAIEIPDQYGDTPLDMTMHQRIKNVRGTITYKRNTILRMIRRRLRRGVEYWEMMSGFRHALDDFRGSVIDCDVLTSALDHKYRASKELIADLDFELAPLQRDETCPFGFKRLCNECPEGLELMRMVQQNLDIYGWASDEQSDEEDMK